MPEKKKQHLIPQCYLRAFTDPIPPKGVSHQKYKPSTWLIDKSFKKKPALKGLKNVFWKPYFYNLDEDNPSEPVTENFLSTIETNYSNVLRKIEIHEQLDLNNKIDLILFIDTLFRRTKSQVSFWQKQIDEIEKMYRLVDRTYNSNENASNEYFLGSHELSKRMVKTATGSLANIILQEGFSIVKNDSDLPFFSSDHPVIYTFMHIDDLFRCGIPQAWTYGNIGTNEKRFFCFCPLTPNYAFISSPFIKIPKESVYRIEKEFSFSFGMNFVTQRQAKSVLISSIKTPYANYQEFALKIIESIDNAKPREGKELIIYTNQARYTIKVSQYERIDDHPVLLKIKFWTESLKEAWVMASHQKIDLIEFYKNGKQMGGTRNLKFTFVSTSPDEASIMEADW